MMKMDKHFGNIEVPISLVGDIEQHIHSKMVKYKTKFYHDPEFIVLNRVAYGAFKVFVAQKLNYSFISEGSCSKYQGITVMCYPEQGELVKCVGSPDNAFFYE